MSSYPVHYNVEHPARFSRLQLLVRLIAFWLLGMLGASFGTLFAIFYLGLPIFAASRLSVRSQSAYVDDDGPRVVRMLAWVAAIAAWTALIADRLPERRPEEVVKLEIERTGRPTPSSSMWRLLSGLPSALLLAILGCIGTLVWLWAALSILVTERVGAGAFQFLVGLQRWTIRLLAYQASLVDEYPPFSLGESPPPALPAARVTP